MATFNNRMSIAELKSAAGDDLRIVKNPKSGKHFFTCGRVTGYISKAAMALIENKCKAEELQYAEVTTDEGEVVPTIMPQGNFDPEANVIAKF